MIIELSHVVHYAGSGSVLNLITGYWSSQNLILQVLFLYSDRPGIALLIELIEFRISNNKYSEPVHFYCGFFKKFQSCNLDRDQSFRVGLEISQFCVCIPGYFSDLKRSGLLPVLELDIWNYMSNWICPIPTLTTTK